MIIKGWGVWHPTLGFAEPYTFEGAIAWIDLDGAIARVKILNAEAGTNNRNGWRAVPVEIVRAPQ